MIGASINDFAQGITRGEGTSTVSHEEAGSSEEPLSSLSEDSK